jgi:hypothetical protein
MPEIANLNLDQIMVYLFRTYSPRKVLKTAGSYLVINTVEKNDKNKTKYESESESESESTVVEVIEETKPETKPEEHITSNNIDEFMDKELEQPSADEDDENESKEINIKVNINVRKKLSSSKIADGSRKFKTKRFVSKNVDGLCNGILTSGKPCQKTKFVEFNLCKRCYGKLKEKGKVKFDEELGFFYRDIKFTVDDPNGLFLKGQTIRQYSKAGHIFEFTGLKIQNYYYVYTRNDALDNFKHCSIITTANPFVRTASLEEFDLAKYEIIEKENINNKNNKQDEEDDEDNEDNEDDEDNEEDNEDEKDDEDKDDEDNEDEEDDEDEDEEDKEDDNKDDEDDKDKDNEESVNKV